MYIFTLILLSGTSYAIISACIYNNCFEESEQESQIMEHDLGELLDSKFD